MMTSNFARAAKHPNAVAISRGVPGWFKGRRYEDLAPTREMLSMPPSEYEPRYAEILAALDARQVWCDLGESAILLCWEAPGEPCHRRTVARWLEEQLGVSVPEMDATLDLFQP